MKSSGILLAGAFTLSAAAASAAPVPCVNGTSGVYPCSNVDMLARLTLPQIGGGNGNDVWGWTDPVSGKEYAIVGLTNGTAFVDLSVPENPVYLGQLPAPSEVGACVPQLVPSPVASTFASWVPEAPDHGDCSPNDTEDLPHLGFTPNHCGNSTWRDHEVYANHVYIGSEQGNHGLVVFDLTTLRNVSSPPVVFNQTARYCGIGSSHTITVNTTTGFVYANGGRANNSCPGGTGGPHIVNVQVPGTPVFAGCNLDDGYTHDSQCLVYQGPDIAHQGKSICINSNEDTLTVHDVTNPAAVVRLSRTTYQGVGYTHQGWLTHDHRYFLLDDELDESDFGHGTKTYIWDFADLDAPILMGAHIAPTPAIDHQQFVHSNYVYQSNYRAGLRILETKDIAAAQLTEVGFFDVYPANDNRGFNGTWANYPFYRSGIVVVTTIEQTSPGGFFVVRPRFADLAVTVTDTPDPVAAGQNVTYVFTIRNQGPTWSDNTTLTDALPASLTLVSANASQGTCTGTTTVTCNLGTLQNTATATVTIVARADVAGTVNNSGVAASAETDTRLTDNTATAQTTVTQAAQAAEPAALTVDAGGNRVFQANEGAVVVAPTWRNIGTGAITLTGAATAFTGPAGPTYSAVDAAAAYPAMAPAASAPCSDCYGLAITAASRPALHWDSTFVETVNPSGAAKTWTLHVGDSFTDVPASSGFFRFVETILHRSVTSGCTATTYCPQASTSREQMAVFALVSKEGAGYAPPACAPPAMFGDVPTSSPFCRWIEELARRGVVSGCGGGNYCPTASVTRDQMAIFALKTLEGPTYVAPPCGAPLYGDVPASSPFCPYIEELTRRGVVSGCGGGNYCPASAVSREQMSVFLTVTFGLTLYGL